ncbi:SGNH/GDSL hydrolase family protein [Phocaeicola salanitronis]|uniref:SGNH/GDSL hydrolase family protein n=1 Tax=Phocaeicola salanitronis TaxID=376805 RepID=UPI0023F7BD2A|nr:SGNH/GDSL hydrolase family protein [Phocaeicola salanitronis]
MAAKKVQLKDNSGNKAYPVTSSACVGMSDGSGNLDDYIKKFEARGYLFAGVATPATNPGTPDGNVFYLATEAGTYANFNGIEIADGEAVILEWRGSWAKKTSGFATQKKLTELESETENLERSKAPINNNYSESKLRDKSDGFYFTDSVGNVIVKITQDGLQAIKLLDKDGNEIGGVKGEDGTVPVIINNKLIPSSIKGHPLYGKLIVSLGDSHRTSAWYDKFCELTGSHRNTEIDNYIGDHQYDYDVCALMMGQAMALAQYCNDHNITPRLILIENCHFGKITKDIDAYVPLREDNIIEKVYASSQDWKENINADLPNIISSNTPKLRSEIKATFNTKLLKIPFSADSVTAGIIKLTIDSRDFNISVEEGDNLEDALTKLNDWAFNDYTDWSNESSKGQTRTDSIELRYIGENADAPYDISFDSGTTGIIMGSIEESITTGSQRYFFNSFDLKEWNTTSKWIATNGTACYPSMKALIEYLKEKFPSTEIVVWAVQWLQCYKPTSGKKPNFANETYSGSGVYVLNIDEYYANTSVANYLSSKEAMKNTAEYYNCRFLDVDKACGINIFNMFEGYYNENNLHPKVQGYERWGETLARLY